MPDRIRIKRERILLSKIEERDKRIAELEKQLVGKIGLMTYTVPQLGDNIIKRAKLIRICKTRGCAKPVFISQIYEETGRIDYTCPEHGKRNIAQMDWMDVTGSTMLEFRKVGL